jgi:pimeloyl-ACP methyl ester carboxylesterase
MPQAENQGVHIHYELEGSGPPLVLMHGFSGNLNAWRGYGFVDLLKTDYQLILIDARGHGESDKPHTPEAYDHRVLVADIIAVLDHMQLPRTHYWGYSMGGKIGFGLAKYYPNRLRSLIIGGMSPYDRVDPNEPDETLIAYEEAIEKGIDHLITTVKTWYGSITPAYEARLRNADLHAATAQMRWRHTHTVDYGNDLASMRLPILVYAGSADEPAFSEGQESVAQLPHARFVALPGMNHVQVGAASSIVVPYVKEFLAEIA